MHVCVRGVVFGEPVCVLTLCACAAMQNESQNGNTCYCWSSGLAGTGFQFPLLDSSAPFLGRFLSFILSILSVSCVLEIGGGP